MTFDSKIPFLEIDMPELVTDIRTEFHKLNNFENYKDFGYKFMRLQNTESEVLYTEDQLSIISRLLSKYPFLTPHTLIFALEPYFAPILHRDKPDWFGVRTVSINIPISGCDTNWKTEFFNIPEEDMHWVPERNAFLPKPGVTIPKKFAEYSLTEKPIIAHTLIPHRITNRGSNETRVSLSWTTRFTTWESAGKYFSQYVNP